jgi:hypothetical protein
MVEDGDGWELKSCHVATGRANGHGLPLNLGVTMEQHDELIMTTAFPQLLRPSRNGSLHSCCKVPFISRLLPWQ